MKKIAPKEQKNTKPEKEISVQKRKGWIKFIRVLIYVVSIIGVTVGASLIKTGGLSAAYADGTYAAKINNGEIIFFVSLIILCGNIMWGILRWFLRGYREKWKPGRIIGKLIGGGIWRTLVIVPLVLFSFLVIASEINRLIDDSARGADVISLRTVSKKISKDYDNGNISLDDYVVYLLNALYDSKKLPEKYKGDCLDIDNKVFEIVEENFDTLTSDTLEYFYRKATLADVGFGNAERAASGGLLSANAYASDGTVTIAQNFDGAKLTRDGHFVVFYEDYGNVVQKVDFISDTLEDFVAKYHSIFGQNWSYHPVRHGGDSKEKRERDFKELLSKNGIPENILDTAMPVYIFDTGESYVAQRVGTTTNGLTRILAGLVDNPGDSFLEKTTFSLPYIIMQSGAVLDSSDTTIKEVLAHELSHHYVDGFCRSNSPIDATCKGLGEFTSEAFAQYMASVIVDKQEEGDFLNTHHNDYINLATCHKINEILGFWDGGECSDEKYDGTNLGYPATVFFENYAEFVPDFNDIIFRIAASTDDDFQWVNGTSNLLEFLYNKVGPENFKKVVVQLAQRNLTNDYGDKKSFYAKKMPPGQDLPCLDFCNQTYDLEPVSSKYYYFSTSDNIEYVNYKASDSAVSILGKGMGKDWELLYVSDESGDIKISDYALDYEVLAVVVTNYDIVMDSHVEFGVFSKQFVKMLENLEDLAVSGENIYTEISADCQELNINDLFELPVKMFDFGIEALNFIDFHDTKYNFNDTLTELENEKSNFLEKTESIKEEVSNYKITICQSGLGMNRDFEKIRSSLQNAMGWNMNLYDEKNGTNRVSVFFGFDLLTRQGKIYVLAEDNDNMGLITINVFEKY